MGCDERVSQLAHAAHFRECVQRRRESDECVCIMCVSECECECVYNVCECVYVCVMCVSE